MRAVGGSHRLRPALSGGQGPAGARLQCPRDPGRRQAARRPDPRAAGLAKERIFAETDSALEERLRDLVRSLSTGPMEAVALRMVDHFVGASGTAFEDATLNDEVRKNPAFAEYWADIEKHGGDRLPFPGTGNGFKAWYILQHYRQAKPFVTEIRVSLPVSSG